MKKATLKQAAKILSIFENTPSGQIQTILSSGLLTDLRDGDISNVDREEFREILNLKPLTSKIFPDYLVWWKKFYQEEGIKLNLNSLEIPEKPEGDWWLIVVAHGMTYKKVIGAMYKEFKVSRINNNPIDGRMAIKKPYAIWVRARIEADFEMKDKTAIDLIKLNIPTITLLERLLLEIFYFSFISNGSHLDNDANIYGTVCPYTRDFNGHVPIVGFNCDEGHVFILWTSANVLNCNMHSRHVVT